MNRPLTGLAAALAAATLLGGAMLPAAPAAADPSASFDCRMRVGAATAGPITGLVADVRPDGPRPDGQGFVGVSLGNAGHAGLIAETLFCRRDGGLVPAHGGANIADVTGCGILVRGLLDLRRVRFELHVEDRGPNASIHQDYVAIRITDADDDDVELFNRAGFVDHGEVELIPVSSPA